MEDNTKYEGSDGNDLFDSITILDPKVVRVRAVFHI